MSSSDKEPLALRPAAACKLLSVSARTLWTWTQAGIIPAIRVGTGKRKVILYAISDLKAWLERQATAAKGANNEPR